MDISLSELAEVKGIGKKTIQRIREYKLADDGYTSEYDDSLHLDRNSVNQGDCLKLMNGIPNKSVDMILADLPYGTTACGWDSIIDLDKLWLQYERVIKDNGAIVLTASQPFTTKLINSNLNLYRYEWIWIKSKASNFQNARKMPMKKHENVLVFYKSLPVYNQGLQKLENPVISSRKNKGGNLGHCVESGNYYQKETGFNTTDIYINSVGNNESVEHATQKPVALFEYLIKTYTNKGDLVLDNVAGSGTTGVACQNTDRNYILIEQEEKYIDIIKDRLRGGDTNAKNSNNR